MIDPTKCEFEEYYHDPIDDADTYYFDYPVDDYHFRGFLPLEEYGDVVCVCISLVVFDGKCEIMASPTVADGDSLSDVDWCGLVFGIDYDDTIEQKLLQKGKEATKCGN